VPEDSLRALVAWMTEAYHAVLEAYRRYSINTQQAAHVVAVEHVTEAMRLRGWV
jgi:glutamate dehydrogenase/leucine dehydrogenase